MVKQRVLFDIWLTSFEARRAIESLCFPQGAWASANRGINNAEPSVPTPKHCKMFLALDQCDEQNQLFAVVQ